MVHAGLDILRSEITRDGPNAVILDRDKVELIEQIFSASGSSIDILDDLLIYEHIDSGDNNTYVSLYIRSPTYFLYWYMHNTTGAFALDLSWHSMLTFLTGKFAWANILADKKTVRLTIQDNPLALQSLDTRNNRALEG